MAGNYTPVPFDDGQRSADALRHRKKTVDSAILEVRLVRLRACRLSDACGQIQELGWLLRQIDVLHIIDGVSEEMCAEAAELLR